MRIAYIHQYFNTPAMSGGTRSYELARRLVAAGHEVHMITSARDAGGTQQGWYTTVEDGIQVHWLPVPYSNHMSYAQRLRAFFGFAAQAGARAADTRADVVFATSTPLTVALPGIYAKRRLRCPLVFEVRDLWPELPIAIGALRHPVAIWLARKLERLAYFSSRRVVALSPGMRAGIVATGYPASRVSVIPNSCDFELFAVSESDAAAFRAELGWLEPQQPLVLYAGTLGKINGVAYLARLAAEVARLDPAVRFLVIGDGQERAHVEAVAAELGVLGHSFHMLAAVPKQRIPQAFAACTVSTSLFVDMPEMWANSANKFFDTLAASRPVAINYGGWQAELVQAHGAGLVLPPGDLPAAAAALVAALRQPGWAAAAGRASGRLAREHFDRDLLAAELERVLLEAVEAGPWRLAKRWLDVVVALAMLVLLAPVLALVALALALTTGRPVLFSQERPGLHGRVFRIYKFRSMTDARDGQGQLLPDGERLTPIGRFIRRTSLDELPQLFNVLRGELSLVGPRPLLVRYLDRYSPEQARRHEVPPGITGWAQVNGRNALGWEERFRLDVWYVDHWSLGLDLKILLLTLLKVARREGVSAPNEATVAEFMGSPRE